MILRIEIEEGATQMRNQKVVSQVSVDNFPGPESGFLHYLLHEMTDELIAEWSSRE